MKLTNKANCDEIKSFITFSNNEEVSKLFKLLDFYEINFSNFVVNDRLLYGTEFENTIIMKNDLI